MGFKVALPYLPGMMFGMNAVQWDGIDGMKDQEEIGSTRLGGNLSDNLYTEAMSIRTDYKDGCY